MTAPIDLFVLKSPDYGAWLRSSGGQLPYRIDLLEKAGLRIGYSDAIHHVPWTLGPLRRRVDRLERLGAPFLQTALALPLVARAPVTLAMFESEGHTVAWLRSHHVWPTARTKLVVFSCWLAELLPRMSPRKLALYRQAYRGVDRVLYLSSNQGPVLSEQLGVPPEKLRMVHFGVDEELFRPSPGDEQDFVLVAGRDRGRDWPTTFAALAGTGLAVKVLCRPADLAGVEIPGNAEVLGYVDRLAYRDLLARARVVVVATRALAYPTGQSVALEAMAMAKACVVTETPATTDYLIPSVNALAIPPADPGALRQAVTSLANDDALRARLGQEARRIVEERFTAGAMWAAVAQEVRELRHAPEVAG